MPLEQVLFVGICLLSTWKHEHCATAGLLHYTRNLVNGLPNVCMKGFKEGKA